MKIPPAIILLAVTAAVLIGALLTWVIGKIVIDVLWFKTWEVGQLAPNYSTKLTFEVILVVFTLATAWSTLMILRYFFHKIIK